MGQQKDKKEQALTSDLEKIDLLLERYAITITFSRDPSLATPIAPDHAVSAIVQFRNGTGVKSFSSMRDAIDGLAVMYDGQERAANVAHAKKGS